MMVPVLACDGFLHSAYDNVVSWQMKTTGAALPENIEASA